MFWVWALNRVSVAMFNLTASFKELKINVPHG